MSLMRLVPLVAGRKYPAMADVAQGVARVSGRDAIRFRPSH